MAVLYYRKTEISNYKKGDNDVIIPQHFHLRPELSGAIAHMPKIRFLSLVVSSINTYFT